MRAYDKGLTTDWCLIVKDTSMTWARADCSLDPGRVSRALLAWMSFQWNALEGYVPDDALVQVMTSSSGAQQALQRLARRGLLWSCRLAAHREQSAAISLDQLGCWRFLQTLGCREGHSY